MGHWCSKGVGRPRKMLMSGLCSDASHCLLDICGCSCGYGSLRSVCILQVEGSEVQPCVELDVGSIDMGGVVGKSITAHV